MEKVTKYIYDKDIHAIYHLLLEIKSCLQKEAKILPLNDWITAKETMLILGIKSTSLYKLRKSGDLIATKTRPIFYSSKSIQEYLKKKAV